MGNYFILRDGRVLGPFTANDIKIMAADGGILIDDQVKKGNGQWFQVTKIKGLLVNSNKQSESLKAASIDPPKPQRKELLDKTQNPEIDETLQAKATKWIGINSSFKRASIRTYLIVGSSLCAIILIGLGLLFAKQNKQQDIIKNAAQDGNANKIQAVKVPVSTTVSETPDSKTLSTEIPKQISNSGWVSISRSPIQVNSQGKTLRGLVHINKLVRDGKTSMVSVLADASDSSLVGGWLVARKEELIKIGFVIREQNDSEKNEYQICCLVSQPHEPVVVAKIALISAEGKDIYPVLVVTVGSTNFSDKTTSQADALKFTNLIIEEVKAGLESSTFLNLPRNQDDVPTAQGRGVVHDDSVSTEDEPSKPGLHRLGYTKANCLACGSQRSWNSKKAYSDKRGYGLCDTCGPLSISQADIVKATKAGFPLDANQQSTMKAFMELLQNNNRIPDNDGTRAVKMMLLAGHFRSEEWHQLTGGK